MVCLDPNKVKKPAQVTDTGIQPEGNVVVSNAYPPQMLQLLDSIENGTGPNGAFTVPENIQVYNDIVNQIKNDPRNAGRSPNPGGYASGGLYGAPGPANANSNGLSVDEAIMNNMYKFTGDLRFDPYTDTYEISLPPLLPDTGGIDDVLSVVGNHLIGIENMIHGLPGSLGLNNIFRTLSMFDAETFARNALGLPPIPDCGLINSLFDSLLEKLQPLANLLAKLIGPVAGLIEDILGIMAAIIKELKEILAIAQRLTNLANSSQLLRLDPCAIILTGSLGQTNFLDILNDAREIVDPLAKKATSAGRAVGIL